MYEPVDLTEESATKAATGSTMQGEEFCPLCSACFNMILTHAYTSLLFEGIPANPKTDHHWVKRKSTKDVFCQNIFNFMPCFFLHHQIDLAQQDGKNILLSMITQYLVSFALILIFPKTMLISIRFLTLTFNFMFSTTLASQLIHSFIFSVHNPANEPDALV